MNSVRLRTGALHREVQVLFEHTISGSHPNLTAPSRGGVESKVRGTGGPQVTNMIRPDVVASPRSDGEAQMSFVNEGVPVTLKGIVSKRSRDGVRCLMAERWEVSSVKQGDPDGGRRAGGKSEPT